MKLLHKLNLAFVTILLGMQFVSAQSSITPIKIIVPFTPGTGMDSIARAVQPKLAKALDRSVIVENHPGASGNIGAVMVAKSAPDGNTLLMGANTMLITSQIYKNANYNPINDFLPVTMGAWGSLMLVTTPKTQIKSLEELINLAKKQPGVLSFGSPGVGTPHHMAMELLNIEANMKMLHVPYKGSAGYTNDLLSGELKVGFLPVHIAQSFVANGKLIPLAISGNKRHQLAPSVPTFAELGLKNVDVDLWYAFFLPANTSPDIVNQYNKILVSIIKSPDLKESLEKIGLDAKSSTPKELKEIVEKDFPRWGKVIQINHISME